MNLSTLLRHHWAALRALLLLTVLLGLVYPALVWVLAQAPVLKHNAEGSLVEADGRTVGSSRLGQLFTDADGNPLPQYFQSRPSAAGDGYDPMATSASNLGPEDIVDTGDRTSLLTLVCARSLAVGEADGVSGARPFCTNDGVGAVLSVIGPRDARGTVVNPTRVISVNQPCADTTTPFVATYEGVRVECNDGQDFSLGQIVAVEGAAGEPQVPADAVTASGSGLDPDISPAYADLQVERVAQARGISAEEVRAIVADHTRGRDLGFMGQPRVNVLAVNLALDGRSGRPA
ncbi:potassium-transporting ATPase subunit C [Mycolicibacterium vaccae]|uniref:Potassium-transporting ATPase KdpC subunit n=1 Tax=Mycolicibacterium vaccae ATCC 25954 TaxID=1194972 RepID=K0UDJ9_MYCVA|nr:potassium-transporting ATPase subunit C [Mycolicibacterium vaccae]ANI39586.1 K transporting ATPase KdpC subunit [Mycolicibacterium vaccae 95051]EJZ04966.1 K transporting ATPase KdpC subunit [Mycolicibacterium vaccae ATCC 25954]MCV7060996.1 potassium-transporting ATPase subunit C [Mycolicibacterium vaccae]